MYYEFTDSIALIVMDDGKANAVGPTLQAFINDSLDRALADKATAVILRGRDGLFSAGFDLKEFEKSAEAGISMVEGGMELLIRLYALPMPVVAASTGHAVAMGAFLLLACDSRIGLEGDYRITLPETRIGMEIPRVMQCLCDARISPRYMTQAVVQSEVFDPGTAVAAGFLDAVASAERFEQRVASEVQKLSELPTQHYAANKLVMRKETLLLMQRELEAAPVAAR